LRRFTGLGRGLGRHGAFLFPAHQQQVRQVFYNVAQGVDIGVRGIGAKLQAQVAVALGRIQGIVGEALHAAEALGLYLGQAKTLIEQGLAHGYGDGQVVRGDHRAQDARVHGRQLGVDLGDRPAFYQKGDALIEGAQQAFEVFAVRGQHIKGHQHACGRARGDDAVLV